MVYEQPRETGSRWRDQCSLPLLPRLTPPRRWLIKSMPESMPRLFPLVPKDMMALPKKGLRVHFPAAKAVFPILNRNLDPYPASYIRHELFSVLDPEPAVLQAISRQSHGPLSARAKRRGATQSCAFQPANGKTGHWIAREHTPRTLGGVWVSVLSYLMPSMP